MFWVEVILLSWHFNPRCPDVLTIYTPNIVVYLIQITWQMKQISFDHTFALQGVYKLRATFVDTRSKEEVGCFEANWTISKVHRKQESQRLLFFRTKRWVAGP